MLSLMAAYYTEAWWKPLPLREILQRLKREKPAFASGIEGSSPEEIDALEALVGRPLPLDYRVFLEFLGGRSDFLFSGRVGQVQDGPVTRDYPLKYDFTLARVKAQYTPIRKGSRKMKRGVPEFDKERYLLIGFQEHSQDGGCYFLDCVRSDPPVVNIDAFGELRDVAPSLKEFVMEYGLRRDNIF
jgi:hypothetical protein